MKAWKYALIGMGMAAAVASASAADITVLRGDAVETVHVSAGGPTVLRGGGTMRVNQPKETEAVAEQTTYAGDTLWLVSENEPIVACFLIRTEYVGRRKIRCTDRRY